MKIGTNSHIYCNLIAKHLCPPSFSLLSIFLEYFVGVKRPNTTANFTHPVYHTAGTITDTSLTLLLFKRSFKSLEESSVATQVSAEQGFIYYCFFQMGDGLKITLDEVKIAEKPSDCLNASLK